MDKKITDVDFLDSLDSNESFFVNKNSSIKQINKSNIVFGINNGGTGATTIEEARENLGVASLDDLNDLETRLETRVSHSETASELSLLAHTSDKNNPHNVSIEQIGAAAKPISFSITVPASRWESGVQSVNISPYNTINKNIIVVPSPESYINWVESVSRCSNYTETELEFSCVDAPVKDLIVNILMLG